MLPHESEPTGEMRSPKRSNDHAAAPRADVWVDLPTSRSLLGEDIEDAPFWKEVVAFASMPESRLLPYHDKYIAVYRGNVVDSDADEAKLALRFYRTFGYVPVYIHRVGIEDCVIDLND
jgi:hypothetical protein